MNINCTSSDRYLRGFNACLYLHSGPLEMALLICTISIIALFVVLFLMLATAQKLVPKLHQEKHDIVQWFLSNSNLAADRRSHARSTASEKSQQRRTTHDGSERHTEFWQECNAIIEILHEKMIAIRSVDRKNKDRHHPLAPSVDSLQKSLRYLPVHTFSKDGSYLSLFL